MSSNQIETLNSFNGILNKLVKLSLKKNKLVSLAKLDSFPAVTYLKLSRNNLTSLESLSVLSNLKSLKGISLYKNPLAEDRDEYLRAVHEYCPTLESLDHEVQKGKDPDQISLDTKPSQQPGGLSEITGKNTSTPTAGYREGASKRQQGQGVIGGLTVNHEPRASSANQTKKPVIQESSSVSNPRSTKISKAGNSQGGQISIIQAGNSGGFGTIVKAASVERVHTGPNDVFRQDAVKDENMIDDDEIENTKALQLDGQKGSLSRTGNSDQDTIYSMDPKSLDTIKTIFEKKMKDRPTYMSAIPKKEEEIWLGNPNHPIGFCKKITNNNYKITGDGLWMMMYTKTIPVKTIEEISFEYVFMDNLKLPSVMAYLSQMKKLKNLRLSFNNMVEYLELVKFEVVW